MTTYLIRCLREAVKAKGLKLNEISGKIGTAPSHLSRILNGKVQPSSERADAIACAAVYTLELLSTGDRLAVDEARQAKDPTLNVSGLDLISRRTQNRYR